MTDSTSRAPRRVTLADVAKRAGVSPALVSIVMRDAPGASAESRAADPRGRRATGLPARCPGPLPRQPEGPRHRGPLRARRPVPLRADRRLYAAAEERGWDLVLSALTAHPGREACAGLAPRLPLRRPDHARPEVAGAPARWSGPARRGGLAGRPSGCRHRPHLRRPRHGAGRPAPRRPRPSAIAHLQGGTGLIALARRDAYLRRPCATTASRTTSASCPATERTSSTASAPPAPPRPEGPDLPTALIAFNDDIAAAAMCVLAQGASPFPATSRSSASTTASLPAAPASISPASSSCLGDGPPRGRARCGEGECNCRTRPRHRPRARTCCATDGTGPLRVG